MASPDDPTRRQPPTGAHQQPPPGPGRERVVETYEDDGGWRQALMDRLDSLRTATAVLGLVAVAALGIAVWALLASDDDEGGGGNNAAQVRALRDRVDQLESQVEDTVGAEDLEQLQQDQQALSDRVDEVAQQAEAASGQDVADEQARQAAEDLGQSVTDLQDSVTELEQRIADLESAAANAP